MDDNVDMMEEDAEEKQRVDLRGWMDRLRLALSSMLPPLDLPEGTEEEGKQKSKEENRKEVVAVALQNARFHSYGAVHPQYLQREIKLVVTEIRRILAQYQAWGSVCPRPDVKRLLQQLRDKQQQRWQISQVTSQVNRCLFLGMQYMEDLCPPEGSPCIAQDPPLWVYLQYIYNALEKVAINLRISILPMEEISAEESEDGEPQSRITLDLRNFVLDIVCSNDGNVRDVKLENSPFCGIDSISVPFLRYLLQKRNFQEFEEKVRQINDFDIIRTKFKDTAVEQHYEEICSQIGKVDSLPEGSPGNSPRINVEKVLGEGQLTRLFEGFDLTYYVSIPTLLHLRRDPSFQHEHAYFSHGLHHLLIGVEEGNFAIPFPASVQDGEGAMAMDTSSSSSQTYSGKSVSLNFVLFLRPPILMTAKTLKDCLSHCAGKSPEKQTVTRQPDDVTIEEIFRGCQHSSTIDVFGCTQVYTHVDNCELDISDNTIDARPLEVERLPFTRPHQVHEIRKLLRQQLIFKDLYSSCFPTQPSTSEGEGNNSSSSPSSSSTIRPSVVLDITAKCPEMIHVTTLHKAIVGLSLSIRIHCLLDGNIDVQMECASQASPPCSSEYIIEILQQTRSIPLAMHNLLRKAQQMKRK